MKIEIFGGQDEIGGNKILLSHNDTRILLDFGMSFSQTGWYFSEFLQPRKCASLRDFFEFDLLPDIPGIYRRDYLTHMGRDPADTRVDAVFLSHAHMDHAAYIHFLRKDIPIYCTEPTKILLQYIEETGSSSFADFFTHCETFTFYENRRGDLSRVSRRKSEYVTQRTYHVMDQNTPVRIGSLEVEMVPVDHSLPGACGYIIYSDDETVVYSGDLRFHGHHGEKTESFVERAQAAAPDIFLCEGTRINEIRQDSETKVRDEMIHHLTRTDGLVFVEHPKKDIDRVQTIYDATKENEREFVVDMKLAYLLEKLGDLSPFHVDDTQILIPKKSWGLIEREDVPDYQVERDYRTWEREFLTRENTVTCATLREHPERYVVSTSFWEINQLVDIKPTNALWIKSSCEPFSEEMELDEDRKHHWLDHFGIPECAAHASGHASGPEIREMVETINPNKLIPIHTEHPELF